MVVFFLSMDVQLLEMDKIIKNPEKSLPKKERKMSEMLRGGGASAYLRRVDKVLDALEQQLVRHEDLAAIVCEGNMLRACSTCGKEVTIRAVCFGGFRVEGKSSVLLHPTSSDLFSCGHSDCPLEVSPEANAWVIAVIATYQKLWETKCDNCFLLAPAQDVHRSHRHPHLKYDRRFRICVAKGGRGCLRPSKGRPNFTLFLKKECVSAVLKNLPQFSKLRLQT